MKQKGSNYITIPKFNNNIKTTLLKNKPKRVT